MKSWEARLPMQEPNMSMKIYRVTIGDGDARREVEVPS